MQPNNRAKAEGRDPREAPGEKTPLYAICSKAGPVPATQLIVSKRRLVLALVLGAMGTGDLLAIHCWLAPCLLLEPKTAIRVLAKRAWPAPHSSPSREADTAPPPLPTSPACPLVPALYFERDEFELHSGHRRLLKDVVNKAREAPERQLLIRGHADRTGPDGWNEALSRWRAHAVAEFLWQHGLDRRRLDMQACGASLPADPRGDEAMNRRVEVLWK